MSGETLTRELDELVAAFRQRLDEIDRRAETADEPPYRAEGAHVMVGASEPLSEEYFRAHGLEPVPERAAAR